MIQRQLKLRLTVKQEKMLNDWLWMLTGVYNWAIRKIELDKQGGIYYTPKTFQNLLAGHGQKIGVPSHTIQGTLSVAHEAWRRCFKNLSGKPKLKGRRNRMNSIPFPDPIRAPKNNRRITMPGLKSVKFHKQDLPEGKIKCGRIIKRASGWYLCLFIDAERAPIERKAHDSIGIDPGFKDLIAMSDGQKIDHPKELHILADRLAQAQRSNNKRLASRIQERIKNQRKDRNHKLSLKLVQENEFIAFSKDNTKGIARKFGKSVASSAHYQLRQMIAYKSRAGGTRYVEVDSRNSTRVCSACGAMTGPQGWAGLKVRQWTCMECGTSHDRDTNAAINTLIAGAGVAHEGYANAA